MRIVSRGGFSDLRVPGKYEMGPYTFAHIYQINLEVPFFFVVMLAAAQWCPVVESNVSTFFMACRRTVV